MGEKQAARHVALRGVPGPARLWAYYGHYRHHLRGLVAQSGGVPVVFHAWAWLGERICLGTWDVVCVHEALLESTKNRMTCV